MRENVYSIAADDNVPDELLCAKLKNLLEIEILLSYCPGHGVRLL